MHQHITLHVNITHVTLKKTRFFHSSTFSALTKNYGAILLLCKAKTASNCSEQHESYKIYRKCLFCILANIHVYLCRFFQVVSLVDLQVSR